MHEEQASTAARRLAQEARSNTGSLLGAGAHRKPNGSRGAQKAKEPSGVQREAGDGRRTAALTSHAVPSPRAPDLQQARA